MDRQGGAGRGEALEFFALGHRRGAGRGARQDYGLRHLRQGQLAAECGGGGGEGRHAGGYVIGNAKCVEPAHLLGDRTVKRRVARMQPGDVKTLFVRFGTVGDDLVERQGGGVDDMRVGRGNGEDLARHQGAGIKTDRAALDQPQTAQRDQIGRAGAGADEMDGQRLGGAARARSGK